MKADEPRGGGSRAPRSAHSLGAPSAHLLAWGSIALLDALVVLLTPLDAPSPRGTQMQALAYDAGQCVAAGIVSAAVLGAAGRARRPRIVGAAALFGLAVGVGALTLPPDLEMRAAKLAPSGSMGVVTAVMLVAVAAVIPTAALVGGLASRQRVLRIAMVASALAVAFANHLFLARNYAGIHLFVTWASAALLGATLPSPGSGWPDRASPRARAGATAVAALASLGAAFAVATRPPDAVLGRMLHWPGLVFAPFLAQLHTRATIAGDAPDGGAFWRPRAGTPDVASSGAAAQVRGEGPPIVLFLTVDCLRADLLEAEANRARFPALFALADRGVRFTQARTVAPATVVALSSIFTGKLFSQLHWTPHPTFGQAFPHTDRSIRFTERLSAAGIETVSVRGIEMLDPSGGIAVGFSRDVVVPTDEGLVFARAGRMVDGLLDALAGSSAGPTFVFAHLLDPHAPYDLGGGDGPPFERYTREVEQVDAALGRLVRGLSERSLAARVVLIVSADHGEAFGEHLAEYHGATVYDEVVRVPLIVATPDGRPAVVDEPVSLLDVGPTVLDLFDLPTPGEFLGESLVPLLAGRPAAFSRPVVAESGRHLSMMVFPDGRKAIFDRRRDFAELYDLRADPRELRNLHDELGPVGAMYATRLRAYREVHRLRLPGYEPPFRPP